MKKLSGAEVLPSDGDLTRLKYFRNGVLCINNKKEVVEYTYQSIIEQYIRNSGSIIICFFVYVILGCVVDYTWPLKLCMSCIFGLVWMEYTERKKRACNNIHMSSSKAKKPFVDNEEEMSKVNVANCIVDINCVKLRKKRWKYEITVNLVGTDYQWREWRSFDEIQYVHKQLLIDLELYEKVTTQTRSILKTPLDIEDCSKASNSETTKKKSLELLNAKLRHNQVGLFDCEVANDQTSLILNCCFL